LKINDINNNMHAAKPAHASLDPTGPKRRGLTERPLILPKASSAYLGAYLSLKMHTFLVFFAFFKFVNKPASGTNATGCDTLKMEQSGL
jgi:hypothetical protein